jgi:D-methionine transport system ATP-binding protein
VVEQGNTLDLFANPKTETSKKFIKSVFDTDLPDRIMEKFKQEQVPGKIVKISFIGDSATEPILADLTLKFSLRPVIIYGNITDIRKTIFGCLIIKVLGESEVIGKGISYLIEKGLQIEVVQDVG